MFQLEPDYDRLPLDQAVQLLMGVVLTGLKGDHLTGSDQTRRPFNNSTGRVVMYLAQDRSDQIETSSKHGRPERDCLQKTAGF